MQYTDKAEFKFFKHNTEVLGKLICARTNRKFKNIWMLNV